MSRTGRPPALTPAQQEEVRRRLAAGEGVRALSAEFGVGKATIGRLAGHAGRVRQVAETLAAAHSALAELPIQQQHQALSLAEKLRSISSSIADAAAHGADTAQHLHALANAEARKVKTYEDPCAGSRLHAVGALTKLANEAAVIPLGLISRAQQRGASLDDPTPDDSPKVIELVGPDDARQA